MFTKRDTNVCKGIAILMMLFHHLFNDYGEYAGHVINYWPFSGDQITCMACLCGGCVTVFVFLSGYGMASVYHTKYQTAPPDGAALTRDLGRRWFHLMERYWFIFLLALLASPLGRLPSDAYGSDLKAGLYYILVDFFGLSYMFGTPTLNPTWWYMSVAISIIVLVPFLTMAIKRFGMIPVFVGVMAGLGVFGVQTEWSRYLFGLLLGIGCREYHVFEKIERRMKTSGKAQAAGVFMMLFLAAFLVRYRLDFRYFGVVDGVVALLVAGLSFQFFGRLPILGKILEVLGEHSANIFFTHNLLYCYYFRDFYYSFRYPVLIVLLLAATSLLLSVLIEKMKIWTGYTTLMGRMCPWK